MTITVLVADDHAILRDGLAAVLDAQRDITVVGKAANGREAVELVSRLRPSVAILDIGMPELNGIEATLQIVDAHPRCGVIILTMYSTSEHIYRALRAGARGYLLKESAGAELVEAVRTVGAGRRYLSEQVSQQVLDTFLDSHDREVSASPLESLSQREREVLQLVVEGLSSIKIAEKIGVAPKTVETYRSRLMHKLGVGDLPALVRFAIQHGVTSLE